MRSGAGGSASAEEGRGGVPGRRTDGGLLPRDNYAAE